jgi:tetraacyldisaccharide 4'-kinase
MDLLDKITSWYERLLFDPRGVDYFFIGLLSPFALLYATYMFLRRLLILKKSYGVPIISIGNIIIGGSGKTPFIISLALELNITNIYIISRGYGRRSRGLVEVSRDGKILTDIYSSGDEPMLLALALLERRVSVVVSEDRVKAINFAKGRGAKLIILDDGFNRVNIKKFEILLFPKNIKNYFPLPAGAFREIYWTKYFANLNLKEDIDFKRVVTIKDATERMLLVTAISNPKRLDKFLPKEGVVGKIYLKDHSFFDIEFLKDKLREFNATSLLVTQKDLVKLEAFQLPISLLNLELEIKDFVFSEIDLYLKSFGEKIGN